MYVCALLLVSVILQQASAQPALFINGTTGGGKTQDIFDINKDPSLTEGDIKQESGLDRNILLGDEYKWEIPVPYVLNQSLDLNAKAVTLRALEQIRLKTCVDFKPRVEESNYIEVIKSNGCWSYIGNIRRGNQSLSIGQFCDHLGIVEHEFLHALGFFHEQSRYDRDEYVTIVWENIQDGKEHNFAKESSNRTTTFGAMYDYISVMHYGKDDFSNGNGSTIITKLPEYQNKIGQRREMSPTDVLKLQKHYNCRSAVTFLESCNFDDEGLCDMTLCATGDMRWERANQTETADGNGTNTNQSGGFFMHCSTASGKQGDGAQIRSRRMTPKRDYQCLQFFYFHNGSDEDQLNIWVREFDRNGRETTYLMDQITGPPTSHWQLHYVPLNATKSFQVEFEVRNGAGNSSGGISVDDVNLSETECPHHVWHIPEFDEFVTNSTSGTTLFSPRFVTRQRYGLQLMVYHLLDRFGVFFRLVSTEHDDELQWPCAWRQVTFSLLDQTDHIQQRMSREMSITTDPETTFTGESGETLLMWDNPRDVGILINDTNGESFYAGPLYGFFSFLTVDEFWSGNFIKGGNVFFVLSFDDVSSIRLGGSELPAPLFVSNLRNVTLLPADGDGTCRQLVESPTTNPPTSSATSVSRGAVFSMLAASVALKARNLLMML